DMTEALALPAKVKQYRWQIASSCWIGRGSQGEATVPGINDTSATRMTSVMVVVVVSSHQMKIARLVAAELTAAVTWYCAQLVVGLTFAGVLRYVHVVNDGFV